MLGPDIRVPKAVRNCGEAGRWVVWRSKDISRGSCGLLKEQTEDWSLCLAPCGREISLGRCYGVEADVYLAKGCHFFLPVEFLSHSSIFQETNVSVECAVRSHFSLQMVRSLIYDLFLCHISYLWSNMV